MDIVFFVLLIAFLFVLAFIVSYVFLVYMISGIKFKMEIGPVPSPAFYTPGPSTGPVSNITEDDEKENESEYRKDSSPATRKMFYKKSYDEIQKLIREGGYEIYHKFAPSPPINKVSLDNVKSRNHSLLTLSEFEGFESCMRNTKFL